MHSQYLFAVLSSFFAGSVALPQNYARQLAGGNPYAYPYQSQGQQSTAPLGSFSTVPSSSLMSLSTYSSTSRTEGPVTTPLATTSEAPHWATPVPGGYSGIGSSSTTPAGQGSFIPTPSPVQPSIQPPVQSPTTPLGQGTTLRTMTSPFLPPRTTPLGGGASFPDDGGYGEYPVAPMTTPAAAGSNVGGSPHVPEGNQGGGQGGPTGVSVTTPAARGGVVPSLGGGNQGVYGEYPAAPMTTPAAAGSSSGGLPQVPGLGGSSGGLPKLPGMDGGKQGGLPQMPGVGGGNQGGGFGGVPGLPMTTPAAGGSDGRFSTQMPPSGLGNNNGGGGGGGGDLGGLLPSSYPHFWPLPGVPMPTLPF